VLIVLLVVCGLCLLAQSCTRITDPAVAPPDASDTLRAGDDR